MVFPEGHFLAPGTDHILDLLAENLGGVTNYLKMEIDAQQVHCKLIIILHDSIRNALVRE